MEIFITGEQGAGKSLAAKVLADQLIKARPGKIRSIYPPMPAESLEKLKPKGVVIFEEIPDDDYFNRCRDRYEAAPEPKPVFIYIFQRRL